jgi:hypothetical protein
MSLSSTEEDYLRTYARAALPSALPAIHALASMYVRYGTHTAREVTDVIGPATDSGTYGHFAGFISGTDSRGFRREVRDPDLHNPQTGHFFSFVVWALDGISEFEAAAALGHEFVSDHVPYHVAFQGVSGVTQARAFRDFLTAQRLDPNGTLDYALMDREFSRLGWSDDIHPAGHTWDSHSLSIASLEIPLGYTESDEAVHSGNSLEDLRCTVAGFHFGRLVRSGSFANAARAAAWLERNILDGPCRVTFDGDTPVLVAEAAAP